MANLHLTPSEMDYIKNASAQRGAKATARVERADRHRMIHQDIPNILHAADLATTGGLVGDLAHGNLKGSTVDAAFLLPWFRAGRLGIAAERAYRAEGSLRGGLSALRRGEHMPRTLTHQALTVQLPKARSRLTSTGERMADKVSLALQDNPHVKNIPGFRMLTSGERVAKALGRQQRLDAARRYRDLKPFFDEINKVKKGSDEDMANFWYAQLPASHRNAEGLQLVRDRQAQELEYITSGQARKDVEKREREIASQLKGMKNATMSEKGPLITRQRELGELKLDLEMRKPDIGASLQTLDRLIAKPPEVNEAAINAVHHLSNDRARILIDSGRLDPEQAAERKGSLSRLLGLDPTGEEAYIGHRLGDPGSFGGSFMPSGGMGLGRPKSPKGVGSRNLSVLVRTGRVRPSLHVAKEDRNAAQAFEQANIDRDNLSAMGTAYDPDVKLPAGHALVNPRGLTVPAHWKTSELSQFSDTYDDIDKVRAQAEDMVKGFYAGDEDSAKLMKEAAEASGVPLEDLRVIPERLVNRYYSQFKHVRPPRGKEMKALDKVTSAIATSVVFARIGYVPKNVVQNMVMMLPHQGAFFLSNTAKAGQAMADSELRHYLQTEVGHTGAYGSLKEEGLHKLPGRASNKLKEWLGQVADDPLRMSAFMHEAAAEGVISRVNPILTEKDKQALIHLFTDKGQEAKLNDIRQRAVEAMADFTRLTPDQMRIARRLAIIPSWLVAGTRYPIMFAKNHPVRTALMAFAAAGEPGAPDELHFNQPLSNYFVGSGYLQGINTPWGRLRTNSLSPVSTPIDAASALKTTITGKKPFDFQHSTVFDYVNPAASQSIAWMQGKGPAAFQRLAPSATLIQREISPKATSSFPEDATRLGRLKREFGVVPIQVTDPAAAGSSYNEKTMQQVKNYETEFGRKDPILHRAAESKIAYHDLYSKTLKDHNVTKLSDRDRAALKLAILVESYPGFARYHDKLEEEIRDAPERDLGRISYWMDEKLGWHRLDLATRVYNARHPAEATPSVLTPGDTPSVVLTSPAAGPPAAAPSGAAPGFHPGP
jgi:hypothetical protein